jgi:hypothetical protein
MSTQITKSTPNMPPTALPEPLTLEKLSDEGGEFENFEIYLADSDYRVQLGTNGNIKQIARIEWLSRREDCDKCNDGVVDVDRGGYTSHSTNQVFNTVECEHCHGLGFTLKPIAVLIPTA